MRKRVISVIIACAMVISAVSTANAASAGKNSSAADYGIHISGQNNATPDTPQPAEDFEYNQLEDGTLELVKYNGSDNTVTIPDEVNGKKVVGIGKEAFKDNTSVTNVTLPDSVENIDNRAFCGCSNLTSVIFGKTESEAKSKIILNIGSECFCGCSNLAEVGFNKFESNPNAECELSIGSKAFADCTSLKSIAIPDSLTVINSGTFLHCTSLEKVTLPESVIEIDNEAFAKTSINEENNPSDTALLTVTIYPSVKTISGDAFNGWNNVKIIGYNGTAASEYVTDKNAQSETDVFSFEAIGEKDDNYIYSFDSKNNTAKILEYVGSESSVEIPQEISGKKVTAVGENAFEGCSVVENVNIAESVSEIGAAAFANCVNLNTVIFGDSAEENKTSVTIGEHAFDSCKKLSALTLSNNTAEIGSYAFYCCENLPEVTVPDSVKKIGEHAFDGCEKLTGVTLSNSIAEIEKAAFANTALTEITLPESVVSIGDSAFENCENLTSLSNRSSVENIGDNAFKGCGKLIIFSDNGSPLYNYAYNNSIAFADGDFAYKYISNADSNEIIIVKYLGTSENTAVEIPEEYKEISVTSISENAFEGCENIVSVTVPESVAKIGAAAFKDCTNLKAVNLPNGISKSKDETFDDKKAAFEIEAETFKGCTSLETIDIPVNLTSIRSSAFEGCKALKTIIIGQKVVTIADNAFDNHGKNLTIKGYSGTAAATFADKQGIKFVDVENVISEGQNNGFEYVLIENELTGNYVKINKYVNYGSTSAVIPSTIDNKPVTVIGEFAFENCTKLKSVTIPDTVEDIRNSAFRGSDGTASFKGCENLETVNFSNNSKLTSISEYAFYGCEKLTKINIPNSEDNISIGSYAFQKCSGLEKITLGNSVNALGISAFEDCTALKEITLSENLGSIEDGTFRNCAALEKITVPKNVSAIGSEAFKDCTKLSSVILTDAGLTAIGSNAFENCRSLKEITVPKSVKTIGGDAFKGCEGIVIKGYNGSAANGYALVNPVYYTELDLDENYIFTIYDGSKEPAGEGAAPELITYAAVYKYTGNGSSTDIPGNVGGKNVTVIGAEAFKGNKTLVNVTIAASIEKIEGSAFEGCTKLESVVIPKNVEEIDTSAFADCEKLSEVSFEEGSNIKVIGDNAFSKCTALKEITIPESVSNIGDWAFTECGSLEKAVIENRNTEIGGNAFNGCKRVVLYGHNGSAANAYAKDNAVFYSELDTNPNLIFSLNGNENAVLVRYDGDGGAVDIPSEIGGNTVTSIDDNAFKGCTSVTNVKIPNAVTAIGDYAFSGCRGLTGVKLPGSLKNIGDYAFENCGSLEKVTTDGAVTDTSELKFVNGANVTNLPKSVASIGNFAFKGCEKIENVIIPAAVRSVGAGAFGSCSGLKNAAVMNPNVKIASTAFDGCGKDVLNIYGYKNSTAHKYAAANEFTFKLLEGEPEIIDIDTDTDTESEIDIDTDTDSDSDTNTDTDTDTHTDPDNTPVPTKNLYFGNIDGDEKITSADSLMVLRASVGLEQLTDEQRYFADVNGNGKIDSADSLAILRFSVGLVDEGITIGFEE